MQNIDSILEDLERISKQAASDRHLFGPVYHGTTPAGREAILKSGFKIFVGQSREGPIRHGFETGADYDGIPFPVHFLGYGIYFTTVKAIAKRFDAGARALKYEFYLDAPNMEIINFASPRKMMNWWIEHGYDPELAKKDRVEATKKMTDVLKKKYDAVWFKGKGLRSLLDGDQVCVFDTSRIYLADASLSSGTEIGAKVRRKSDGMTGIILNKRPMPESYKLKDHVEKLEALLKKPDNSEEEILKITQSLERAKTAIEDGAEDAYFGIRWKKGGADYNVYSSDFEPVQVKEPESAIAESLRRLTFLIGQ